jgi:hypothetical protein
MRENASPVSQKSQNIVTKKSQTPRITETDVIELFKVITKQEE